MPDLGTRSRLSIILLAFVGLTLLYNVSIPIYEAPEEPSHSEYVRHLVEERSLPSQPQQPTPDFPGSGSEAHQPPLYYVLVALATSWIDTRSVPSWHPNPYATWIGTPTSSYIALHRADEGLPYRGTPLAIHVGRLVSSLMGLVTVLCTYVIARLVLVRRDVAIGAAAVAAFTPGFVFSSSIVNNDNGVTMLCSVALLISTYLLRRRVSLWWFVIYGLTIGAAILSKANGLLLVPIAVCVMLMLALREALAWRKARAEGQASVGNVPSSSAFPGVALLTRLLLRSACTYGVFLLPLVAFMFLGPTTSWSERIWGGRRGSI